MCRDGSMTPTDLLGKLTHLIVVCSKCDRRGRYRVDTLAAQIGLQGKLTDWLVEITRDCPRRGNSSDPCGARCPDLIWIP